MHMTRWQGRALIAAATGLLLSATAGSILAAGNSVTRPTYTPNRNVYPGGSAGSSRILPNAVEQSGNCHSSCATACNRTSCSGLNPAQCNSVKLSCRAGCRTRC